MSDPISEDRKQAELELLAAGARLERLEKLKDNVPWADPKKPRHWLNELKAQLGREGFDLVTAASKRLAEVLGIDTTEPDVVDTEAT